ncbi:MAG: Fe-S cluster assembly sulfur transfer protein SufU [Gammaproteobacteria bacterium]
MSDLRDLYQAVIIDHSKSPRNRHKLETANHHAEGFNPLCGDKITLYLDIKEGKVHDISFEGSGCAISTASASLMTEQLKNKTLEEANALFQVFHQLLTTDKSENIDLLGKLTVLSGVREYPSRIKCATLAWHAFNAALENKTMVSTE